MSFLTKGCNYLGEAIILCFRVFLQIPKSFMWSHDSIRQKSVNTDERWSYIKKESQKLRFVGQVTFFFLIKNVSGVRENCNDGFKKIWRNAKVLAYFLFSRKHNVFTNFNLKLNNFVFLTFSIFWKITIFFSKSISSICMIFCPN